MAKRIYLTNLKKKKYRSSWRNSRVMVLLVIRLGRKQFGCKIAE